ncbi:hypothetical protein TYRP_013165 [Tyrophagus putrescentiae]|nr:hypothetical protein TYRP_013165 [Tyrophagus putrescentiae]
MAIITNGSPLKPSNTTASSSSSSLEVLRLSSLLPNSLPSRGFFLALFLFSISLALLYIAITWLKMNSSSKGGCSKHWLERFYLVLKEKVSTLVLLLLATLISFTVYNSRNSERHPQPPSVDAYSYDSGDEGQAPTSSYCSSNATAPMLSSEPEEEKSPSPEKSHHHHQHHYNHLYPVLA